MPPSAHNYTISAFSSYNNRCKKSTLTPQTCVHDLIVQGDRLLECSELSVLLYVHRNRRLIRGGGAQDGHLDLHTAPEFCGVGVEWYNVAASMTYRGR